VTSRNESVPIAGYLRACFTSRESPSVSPVDSSLYGDDALQFNAMDDELMIHEQTRVHVELVRSAQGDVERVNDL